MVVASLTTPIETTRLLNKIVRILYKIVPSIDRSCHARIIPYLTWDTTLLLDATPLQETTPGDKKVNLKTKVRFITGVR